MMRGMTILWALLASVCGVGVFMMKFEVQQLEDKLVSLNRNIEANQEAIHVLKAEWSYLNDPTRIQEMAEKHLALKPLKPFQITGIDALPLVDQSTGTALASAPQAVAPAAPQAVAKAKMAAEPKLASATVPAVAKPMPAPVNMVAPTPVKAAAVTKAAEPKPVAVKAEPKVVAAPVKVEPRVEYKPSLPVAAPVAPQPRAVVPEPAPRYNPVRPEYEARVSTPALPYVPAAASAAQPVAGNTIIIRSPALMNDQRSR